jgi:membrane protein implicated in regulation of membrane protease activity
MSPAIKYTLGRVGLFVIVLGALSFLPLNFLVAGMIAIVVSAVASYFLLAKWRNEMNEQLAGLATRRSAEKQRLRAALAGDEDAAAEGDRATRAAEGDRAARVAEGAEPQSAEKPADRT